MRLKELIRSPKTITDGGKWSTGKMPKAAFPLSHNTSYRLGAGWDWRVIRFDAGTEKCRLLVAYHAGKVNYHAWLGVETGADTVIVARLEYHALHINPGWHVHTKCGEHRKLKSGVVKGPDVMRYPKAWAFHKHKDCNVTPSNLLAPAYRYFRIDST